MKPETNQKTVSELAAHVGGQVAGAGETIIKRVASIEVAGEGDITFLEDPRTLDAGAAIRASCLIVPEGALSPEGTQPAPLSTITVARPKLAFALIAALLHPPKRRPGAIHPTACVAPDAVLGAEVYVGPYAQIGERVRIGGGTQILGGTVVGDDVTIGRDCTLHPNVVIYDNVKLGDGVILHAGVTVGADGFGYVRSETAYHKFPQIGTVIIEDDVEIGAHTCIDRGALGRTRIGRGTKIDNLVQIAHNVEIGERVVIAAQTGISGSTVVEDDAVIGGQVGMGDHARVQSGAVIGSKAGILPGKIVRAGVWWGVPVQPLDQYKRLNAHLGRLPKLREEVKELRAQVRELANRLEKK